MGNLYHHQRGKSLIPFIFIQLGLVKPHDWTIQNCSGVFCFRFEWPHVLWHIYIYMYKWYVYPIIIFLLCAHILSGFYINLYIYPIMIFPIWYPQICLGSIDSIAEQRSSLAQLYTFRDEYEITTSELHFWAGCFGSGWWVVDPTGLVRTKTRGIWMTNVHLPWKKMWEHEWNMKSFRHSPS